MGKAAWMMSGAAILAFLPLAYHWVFLPYVSSDRPAHSVEPGDDRHPPSAGKGSFLQPVSIGFPAIDHPRIGSVTLVDLDQDGLLDVLVCDMGAGRIGWIRQYPAGVYREEWIGPPVKAPARVEACDVDQDGDLDLLIACMGKLLPTNDWVGTVVVFENDGKQRFLPHLLLEGVPRVTDVRGGDLDGDGDIDLVVGQFGYLEGETRWMENRGGWKFTSHLLQSLSGPIHTIPADIDSDGDLDIVSLVSQEWEEIYVFENDGSGHFRPHIIFGSTNEDYGSSSMKLVDLDRDGDLDVLFTNGDAFDYVPPRPRPWHGVQWLENQGDLQFRYQRIGLLQGASAAAALDADQDGDLDVVAVSAWNLWEKPESQSMVLFENDGAMNFTLRGVTSHPTHLISVEASDLNRDGWVDLVTGGMHVYAPYTRESRVLMWVNRWAARAD